jgi:DnaD/phage-associated family protein
MTANGRRFNGFLVATEPAIGLPRAFFTDVLPGIADLAELQVTLTVFRLCGDAGGLEQPLPEERIRRDRALRAALRVSGSPREPDRRIETGLELAVARGTLLRFAADRPDGSRVWYYVNTPANQALVGAMARGVLAPPEVLWHDGEVPAIRPERPNVFRLYEQNIGLLTPLIADQLIAAMETYPAEWIEEAIGEATGYNRRSWRYIQRILEKWAIEGRQPTTAASDGTPVRTRA